MKSQHVVLLLFMALVGGTACSDESPSTESKAASGGEEEAISAEVWTLKMASIIEERRWSGQLQPLRTREVQAPREGRIDSLQVKEGDRVRAGQFLARMSSPDVGARRGVLQQRQRQLEEDLARWQQLAEAQAAGPGEVHQAQLRLLEVEESLAEIDATLGAYRLRSPSSGQVVQVNIAPESYVTQGQALLRIDDEETSGLRFSLPAAETAFLDDPQYLRVSDGIREYEMDRFVLTEDVDPAFVRAELYIQNSEEGIWRREAWVQYEREEEVLLVPWTAVASDEERSWVVVVEGEPLRAKRRKVELGRAHAEGIEVLDGVVAGERVIRYEPRSYEEGRLIAPVESSR